MRVIYDPRIAAYRVLKVGECLTLDGESAWVTRSELKGALEDAGYVLNPDFTVEPLLEAVA